MRRFGVCVATAAAVAVAMAGPAKAAAPSGYTASKSVKLDVLGEWAHPDDDTGFIGPCGVWHQRFGTRCGIIMVTRGEGGGNAVGPEIGPALGLRRENEDRVAHYRSGTVDIFNLDRVDFFYNQSAPLTQQFWDERETLRRVTRIIRMTQPEVYIGFTPTLEGAGHGNHQQAGRLIWEGVLAAADPRRFPGQLTGPHALSTWQVKKVFSGGTRTGTGGTTSAADCTTGFLPGGQDNVAGVWTGYDSPYLWPAGNLQNHGAGSHKTWAQVAQEGHDAYPTQSRVMFTGTAEPGCSRFAMTDSSVPFQPNRNPDGTANPRAGRDEAILYGASLADPGGLPRRSTEYLELSDRFIAPDKKTHVTLHLRSGSGRLERGKAALTVPDGWTTDGPKDVPELRDDTETTVQFTVTPPADAETNVDQRISALYTTGSASGYTDDVVRVVPAVEGRFQRWGKWREYDQWLQDTAPAASRLGRSTANQSMALGSTRTVGVVVHNWSDDTPSGDVTLDLPAGLTSPDASKPYGPLDAGDETTLQFQVTSSGTELPANQTLAVPITTTSEAGDSTETLTMSIVPATTIPELASAPDVDADDAEYGPRELDISRVWQGGPCTAGDCGGHSYAKLARFDDDLYVFVHVVDDYQSYAVTPEECVGHWQADSVEILLDPRGNSSERNTDTASTFKLGVFPYTNDPSGSNGNGPNGPCWERDADNHQGYSTGPLANTVDDAPNAPGVEVASNATWVGSNETTTDHAYAGGGYSLEVKIPLADLPAAVDPDHMGLNITPYDNDDTSAPGTTALRHIDMSTRLGWSAFGSVQSDPFRWGVATLAGYTPPAGRPTEAPPANVSHPNLDGAESPQTIFTSARSGVPISGRDPATGLAVAGVQLTGAGAEVAMHATGSGRARIYLWSGDQGQIPVYTSTCHEPAPDFGLTACGTSDGGIPPWSPDQSGRVVASQAVDVTPGDPTVTIPLTADQRARLQHDGSALISFETADDQVQAFDVPLARPPMFLTATTGGNEDGARKVLLSLDMNGPQPFPGAPGGNVQFTLDGVALGAPVAVGDDGHAELTIDDPGSTAAHTFAAAYDGDWDYAPATATYTRAASSVPGPPGPAGPRGPRGKATVIVVACRVAGRKTVKCRIAPVGSKARTTTTIKVRSRSRRRTHKGAYTVTLHTKRRVKKGTKVHVTVRRGSARTKVTVRAGRARVLGL